MLHFIYLEVITCLLIILQINVVNMTTEEQYVSPEQRHDVELVTVYSEIRPEHLDDIKMGRFEHSSPRMARAQIWLAEMVLDRTLPDVLKEKGITRHQNIFTSPVPYQGEQAVSGRVLIAMDVPKQDAYVAEGLFITKMAIGMAGLKTIALLKPLFNDRVHNMSRDEFETTFASVSQESQHELMNIAEQVTSGYWQSVLPYKDYTQRETPYEEPEILLPLNATLSNLRVLSNLNG